MINYLLFSEELFSDTRLSQQPAGGVLKYSEDWLAGVQRSIRQKKPLKSSIILNAFMQNKPNFRRFCTANDDSTQKQTQFKPKTKPFLPPKTNPQTQTNPIYAGQAIQKCLRNYEIPKGKKIQKQSYKNANYRNEPDKQKSSRQNEQIK